MIDVTTRAGGLRHRAEDGNRLYTLCHEPAYDQADYTQMKAAHGLPSEFIKGLSLCIQCRHIEAQIDGPARTPESLIEGS